MDRECVKRYVEEQKIQVVEVFDLNKNKISYAKDIKGWDIKNIDGDEEIVRAYILTKLVNELGYLPKNIQIEYEYTAGRPHTNTSRIDVIVRDDEGDAFLFIELKSPTDYAKIDKDETIKEQLYKVAGMEEKEGHKVKYLVLYTINITGGLITDECIIIDNEKFPTFTEWEKSRDYVDTIPVRYGKAQKTPYIKGSKKDLETNFEHATLDKLQSDLHNVLWGGGGTDDNEVFASLTNLILAKIQDEDEKDDGELYDFQSLTFEKDGDEEFESNAILFERINDLYRRALSDKLYINDASELNKSYVIDTKKFSLSKLKYTVQQLEKFSFVDGKNSLSGKDILGDFFEGIIRTGFKQSKGQFFTHINIVRFILWAIQADKLAIERVKNDKEIPYMIDPSAGSGTFLIEYMKFITENIKYRFKADLGHSRAVLNKFDEWFIPDNRENKWAKEYIYGSEINFNLGTATKVNMILHGDGSTNIFVKDGLLPFNEYVKETAPNAMSVTHTDTLYYNKDVNGQFDIIVTNPPFSVSLDNETKKKLKKSFIFGDKKNSENLFIERYYQLLKENGRMAIVLPESIFDTSENRYIRIFLYKYFKIKAVVSLPQLTFQPYTSTKTSILFAQKKTQQEIIEWNTKWANFSKEYSELRTRVQNIINIHDGLKKQSSLPSIKNLDDNQQKELLVKLLKPYKVNDELNKDEIIGKYRDELCDLCKLDNDTKEEFGYVNVWWVFSQVVDTIDESIFMAETENVGYKRTQKSEKETVNDLFRKEGDKILVDDGIKTTILDYMRELIWD